MIEDSALAYNSPQGLVIVTGCYNAGICNIIEQTKNIFKEEKVIDIIGGFHLQNPSQKQLNGTKSYFRKRIIIIFL